MRVGTGFDAHAFASDRPLILGGIRVPSDLGLAGHSDADVLTHAICDALLGAAALGDLGRHFPSSDPSLRGVSSVELLGSVRRLLDEAGFDILNIDATVIAERPKLTPYLPSMRGRIAEAARVSPNDVSIKATTTDGLGFTGRGEGIAAQAVVLIRSL